MRQSTPLKVPKRIQSIFAAVTILAQLVYLIGPALPSLVPTAKAEEATSTPTPTLTTDKEDYHPGETVVITGVGFTSESAVGLTIVSGTEGEVFYYHKADVVTADSSGSFTYQSVLDDYARPLYTVTAYDQNGTQLAQVTFSDAGPAVSIDQCDNGGIGATPNRCVNLGGPNNHWGSGNLNHSKAHWQEGDFLPYRAVLTGLNSGVNTVTFSFDTAKASESKHAIDYLGSYDVTETTGAATSTHANQIDPCGDIIGGCNPAAPTATAPINNPAYLTSGYPASCAGGTFTGSMITGSMKGWTASPTGISAMNVSFPDVTLPTTGDCSPRFKITFTVAAGTSTVVLAWGGHVAVNTATGVGGNWGAGNAVPTGSPYHMHAGFAQESPIGQSFNVGNQDLQLASSAIAIIDNPTVATQIHLGTNHTTDVQGTTIALGSTVHDRAVVTNAGTNGTPLGTATFQFFNNGTCSNSPTATSSALALTGGIVDATGFAQGPLPAGSYSFKASYTSSDPTKWNNAVGVCEPVTVGQGTSTTATTLHKADHSVVTVGSAVPLGTVMHDSATVTPSSSFAATGTVTFRFYGTQAACTADTNFTGGTTMGTVALSSNVAHPSDPTGALTPGNYAFKAQYSGDANYTGSTSSCENFTVNQSTSSITTELHMDDESVVAVDGHVPLGTIMHDSATVTPAGTIAPTGDVVFTFYTNGVCEGTGTPMGTVALDGANPGVAHPSTATAALGAGTYSFNASWAGDSNYTGNVSSCEPFVVDKAQLTVTTEVHDTAHGDITNGSVPLGSVVHDTAHVAGAVGAFTVPVPTFTMTTNYTDSCAAGAQVATNGVDGGNGDVKTVDSAALAAGTYAYRGSVAGNENYLGDDSPCEPFTVNKAQLSVDTIVHNFLHQDKTNSSVPLGSIMHDTASVSGGVAGFAVPTPTFTLTTNYTDSCANGSVVANDGLDVSGWDKSADSAALAAGSYAYRGSVAGNDNYIGADSICEPFTVDKAQLGISTIVHDVAHVDKTNASVPLGSIMHDTATLTGVVNGFPTPTPSFTMTADYDQVCDDGIAVDNDGMEGDAYKSVASSALSAGSYAYMATVGDNANYIGATGECEPFTVNKDDLNILTDIHDATHAIVTSVPLGTTVHDQANLSSLTPGFAATGNVDFTFYTDSNACQGDSVGAGSTAIDGIVAHPSTDQGPLGAGLYSFKANYIGDDNYNSATGPCEPLVVNKAQLNITTDVHNAAHESILSGTTPLGSVVHDTADVTGAVVGFPTPTPMFFMTANYVEDCSQGVAVANDSMESGSYKSADSAQLTTGSYAYLATIAGNDDYIGDDGDCEPFMVNQGTTQVTTQLHQANEEVLAVGGSVEVGANIHDQATVDVSGPFNPTGAVRFRFYTNNTCTDNFTQKGQVALTNTDPGIAHPSLSTGALNTAGQYSFSANWNGDVNYPGGASDCEPFNVVDASISLTPQEASNQVNDPHTITAHVTYNDGTGVDDAEGVTVNFSVTSGSATFTGDSFCVTDATGTCSVEINSSTTGNNVINATTTFDVGGVSLTRATDGVMGPDGSDAAEKNYVNARISITPATDTNPVNAAHTMVVTVEEDTGNGWTAVEGAIVNALTIPAPNGGLNKADCLAGTDVLGQCDLTINSSVTGVFTTHARTTILVDGVEFKLATDGQGENSDPAEKTYVNARISIDPETATNEVRDEHVFTVTVEQDAGDGNGFVPVLEGTLANAVVTPVPTSFDASDCQDGVDSNGQCEVTMNNDTAGVFTVMARSTVVVGGVEFKLQTNGSGANSGPAVKTYVDLMIDIDQNSTNAINNSHTFTVTVMQNDGSGWTPAVGAPVTPSITGTGSLTGTGTCETGLTDGSGQCTIIVNSPTTGVGTVDASVTYTVGGVAMTRELGDGLSGDGDEATKTWVNAKISIDPSSDTNPVNEEHVMTVLVEQDLGDGNGFVPFEGAIVNAIVIPGTTLDKTDCLAGTDSSGECELKINSATPGVFTTYARSTIMVDGVEFKLSTNGTGDNSGPAVKTYVDVTVTTVIHAEGDEVTNYDLNADPNGGNLPLGSIVHDNATVTPSSGTIDPVGTVTYSMFANSDCSGEPVSSETLANGVESSDSPALAPGDYSYMAHFNGSYPYPEKDGACERLHVNQGSSTTVTELHEDSTHAVIAEGGESVTGNAHDKATVTGDPVFAVPTGTVTFRFYTTQAACTADENFSGGTTKGTVALDGSGVAHPSDATGALAAGNYAFRAQYSGDANYTGSTSGCENFTVSTLTINKLANGGNDTFGYTVTGPTNATPNVTTSGTPGTGTTTIVVLAGSYTVGETTIPAGWQLVGLTCNGSQTQLGPTSSPFNIPAGQNKICNFENTKGGATRTQGFWSTHTVFTNMVWTTLVPASEKNVDLWAVGGCTTTKLIDADAITGDNELMGGFWSNVAKTTTGINRSQLDKSRMTLLQQLLAAELNKYGIGTDDGGRIAAGKAAFCGTNQNAINQAKGALDTWNNSGDNVPLNMTVPSATPSVSKTQADMAFWNTTVN